jgi:hypothetical protein
MSLFLLRLMKNTTTPMMAAKAMTPTTTPTAMPTLLGPPDDLEIAELELAGAAVGATVLVTMAASVEVELGAPSVAVDDTELELSGAVSTSPVSPER